MEKREIVTFPKSAAVILVVVVVDWCTLVDTATSPADY